MFNLKNWVEKPIDVSIREKIKQLLSKDVESYIRSAQISDNHHIILDYLYAWIDLYCAYSPSCDIVDMYYMSLDGLYNVRIEDA